MPSSISHRILIGGSGSTGSSLLTSLLGHHPDIFSTPETSLFAKNELFENWTKNKRRITYRGFFGLKNELWLPYIGVDLFQPPFSLSIDHVHTLIDEASHFEEFADRFMLCHMAGKRIWVEKTPANFAQFSHFLTQFDRSYVVHTVRNPFDAITSLFLRGLGFYSSVSYVLLGTMIGAKLAHHPNYIIVRYEDLVRDPQLVLNEICTQLGISYSSAMIDKQVADAENRIKLDTWNYSENDRIGTDSIGRFHSQPADLQSGILHAVEHIHLSPEIIKKFNVTGSSIRDICELYDYPYIHRVATGSLLSLKREKFNTQVRRLSRCYPHSISMPTVIV